MTGWRDGATATLPATTKETPFSALTVPGDVQAGDVMLVVAACFTFTATSPGISLTSPAGTWTQISPLEDSGAESGLDVYSAVWTRVATGADAGSALTFQFTGVPGTDEMWWAAAAGAWSGFAEASVVSGTAGLNSPAPAVPSADTATDGELAVSLAGMGIEGAGSISSVPGASRENVTSAGVCAAISDAGSVAGQAGSAVGGGVFGPTSSTNWWATFLVTLAPAITVTLTGTSGGVSSYRVSSVYNAAPSVTTLRVLPPASPSGSFQHSFCYALPVEAGLATDFGDGLATLQGLDANDAYNMTVIAPSFGIDPWYADNPVNSAVRYETFLTVLAAWVQANLHVTGTEKHHLIGFSKSGIGGQDLVLKHPSVWTRCATWDFPADMSSYSQFGSDSEAGYGTDANFQANYRLTQAFVDALAGPFSGGQARIWIGGFNLYGVDVGDYDALMTTAGVLHQYPTPVERAHDWDSGWVPAAVAFLAGATPPPSSGPGLLMASGVV